MKRLKYILVIGALMSALFICGCAKTDYSVIYQYTPTAPPPSTIGNTIITYPPVLNFPAGSSSMYELCLQDIARMNNIDVST